MRTPALVSFGLLLVGIACSSANDSPSVHTGATKAALTGPCADPATGAPVASGTVCSPAQGPCDVADICDGVTGACTPVFISAGTPCGAGATCSGSSAACGGSASAPPSTCGSPCTGGQQLCGPSCTTLATDAANCGGCGHACSPGATCAGGACVCPAGQATCGGACVVTSNDPANCGACGHACPGGSVCSSSGCVCTAGLTMCGAACSSLASDSANCGACGNVCGGGTSCMAGACCAPGQSNVGGVCVTPAASGLVVGGAPGSVSLTWSALPSIGTYHVKRSPVAGGPFAMIATASTTSYVDTTVGTGTTYSYVVAAFAGSSEGPPSAEARATSALPSGAWSSWEEVLGATSTSSPSVMTWAPAAGWSGHNDVYFRATDGSMQHSWTLDGGATWSGLESQGPWLQTGSSPSCVSSGVGNVLCAVQGGDNAIYVKTYASATGWSGYRAISPAGTTTSPMSVTVPPGGGTVRAFYRGNDGALWFYTSADNAATWTGPTTLGGGIVGAPGCVAWEQDRVDCVVQGGGATLYYTYFDQNQWFGFAPVAGTAGTVLSAPTLASWQNGRLDALWTGPGNVLEHVWSTGNANGGATWSAVESLGAMAGGIAYAPSCVSKYSAGAYRLDCYATGLADGNIHHKWYDLSTPMAGCNVDSDCGGGARCVYGTCGCNAAYACSSGCCATTPGSRAVAACNAGASNAACGGTGAICQACASGTTCQASACTAPPPPPPFDCDSCACGCNANANACAPPVRCNATACRKSGGYCDPCGGCSM